MARKDVLAAGQRSAQFAAGVGKGKAELKNLSNEPRIDIKPVEIDRTRQYKRIIPKGDMLLIERREPENISAGGILIPETGKDRPAEGTVVTAGPAVKDVKAGDWVLFGLYAGTEYPFSGETLLFVREDEIIATVEK